MKTKSHKLKWATALCSVAFFSSIGIAQGGLIGDPNGVGDPGGAPIKEPQPVEPPPNPRVWWIDPITPTGTDSVASEGTFSGTIVD